MQTPKYRLDAQDSWQKLNVKPFFPHMSDFFLPTDTSSKRGKQKQSHLVSRAHCCQVSLQTCGHPDLPLGPIL